MLENEQNRIRSDPDTNNESLLEEIAETIIALHKHRTDTYGVYVILSPATTQDLIYMEFAQAQQLLEKLYNENMQLKMVLQQTLENKR